MTARSWSSSGRSAGFFARHRMIASWRSPGTLAPSRQFEIGAGGSFWILRSVGDAVDLDRHVPGQHLEEEDSERVDVRPLVELFAAGLLGREVLRLAHDREHLRHVVELVRDRLADAEVEVLGPRQPFPRLHDHDVVRRQVAMDQVPLVDQA